MHLEIHLESNNFQRLVSYSQDSLSYGFTTINSPSSTRRHHQPPPSYPLIQTNHRRFSQHPRATGMRLVPKINQIPSTKSTGCLKRSRISCAVAQPETLQMVQSTIAKQLQVEEGTVTPQTKFADMGADSLDTVEIMMALEEQFNVSVGEGGAENITTVQDAADLIEKMKAAVA